MSNVHLVVRALFSQLPRQSLHVSILVIMGIVLLVLLLRLRYNRRRRRIAPKRRYSHNNFGAEGEKAVAKALKTLGPTYAVLNDIIVSSGRRTQQIDHLAIGPNGIFHIETKHWSGELHCSKGRILHLKNGLATDDSDPTNQMYRHQSIVEDLIRTTNTNVDVTGVLCFSHPNCHLRGKSSSFYVVKIETLIEVIRDHRPKKTLSKGHVKALRDLVAHHSRPTPRGYGQHH